MVYNGFHEKGDLNGGVQPNPEKVLYPFPITGIEDRQVGGVPVLENRKVDLQLRTLLHHP